MITERYNDRDAAACSVSDFLHRGTSQVTQIIDDQPGRSMLMACLAGFGVGLLFSRMLAAEEPAYSHLRAFDRSTAERFGRNLLERVEQALPSMLRDRLTN